MGQWGRLAFANLFSHMPLLPSLELDKNVKISFTMPPNHSRGFLCVY